MTHCLVSTLLGLAFVAGTIRPASAEPIPQTEPEASAASEVLVPPNHGMFELTAGAGVLARETSFGTRRSHGALGLSAGWLIQRWLEVQVEADYAGWKTERGGTLSIRNRDIFVGAGVVGSLWVESLRFGLDLSAGPLISTVAYEGRDLSGASRVVPAVQLTGLFGIALFQRFGFSIRGGVRLHEDRVSVIFTFDSSVFVGATDEKTP